MANRGVTGIILAAGQSHRLGQPKQLLRLAGRPLLQHVLDAANASILDAVVLVLGESAQLIARAITPGRARTAVNDQFADGQSTSIHCGIAAIQDDDSAPHIQAAMILLGDQPAVSTPLIDDLVERYRISGRLIVAPHYTDGIGNPVVFDRSLWPDLLVITGDVGARGMLSTRRDDIEHVRVHYPRPADVDTWEDYQRMAQTP